MDHMMVKTLTSHGRLLLNRITICSFGQILLSQKTALKKGSNIITLNIAHLTPGIYHVYIVNDKKVEFSVSRSIIKR